jgi:hypothetical protein
MLPDGFRYWSIPSSKNALNQSNDAYYQARARKIFCYVSKKWLVETPEEGERQEYLGALLNEYGYSIRDPLRIMLFGVLACDCQGAKHANASFFCC